MKSLSRSVATIVLVVIALSLATFLFIQIGRADQSVLKVYFFDVGQGDSTLIRAPDGTDVLIDGGKGTKVLEELGKALPFSDRHIDMVVLTHPDADHVNGIADVLERYEVDAVLDAGFGKTITSYDRIKEIAQKKNITWTIADDDTDFSLGDGVVMDILWPDQERFAAEVKESNDASIVFRLSFHDIDFLLTADAGSNIEQLFLNENIDSEFLHVGHHGSRYSSDSDFLRAVSPLVSIISVGKNSYGHPHPDTLERLVETGTKTLRTDESGTIVVEVEVDGSWNILCAKGCQ